MRYEPMPKIEALPPDPEMERRVQEILYSKPIGPPNEEVPGVSSEFWIGFRNALLIELAFVVCGLALWWVLGCGPQERVVVCEADEEDCGVGGQRCGESHDGGETFAFYWCEAP